MKKTLKTIALSLALGIVAAGAVAAEPLKVGFAAEPYPPVHLAGRIRQLGRLGSGV